MIKRTKDAIKEGLKALKTKGSFTQNFAITFSGSAFTVIVQLLLTPVIARIYGPEAYGSFGVFNAIVMNAALVASFMFEQAFVLPKKDSDFAALLQLTIGLSILSCILMFWIIHFLGDSILLFLNANQLKDWKYIIAPTVFIICLNQVINSWVIRVKEFRKSVPINSAVNLGIRFFNIGYGLATNGIMYGLILGDIFGKITGLFVRCIVILRDKLNYFTKIQPWGKIKEVFFQYKHFPLYTLPSNWINLFSYQVPIFLLARYFGVHEVGSFALANSLLDMPLRLFGYSISPVFFQKATEVFNSGDFEKLRSISSTVFNKMLDLGVIPFAFLTVFGELIFTWVFGDLWREAGVYASCMGFYYAFRLASNPLDSLYKILNKEQISLYFSFGSLFFSLSLITIGVEFGSAKLSILLYALGNLIIYASKSLTILIIVGANYKKLLLLAAFKICLCLAVFSVLKMLMF